MKRVVATSVDIINDLMPEIWSAFYNVNYDMKVDSNYSITLTATKDADMMPKIEVKTDQQTDTEFIFNPTMIFPDIKCTQLDFSDSVLYYTNRWAEVAKAVKLLYEFTLNIDMSRFSDD